MTTLRTHDVHLVSGPLHLRPMTEDDWDRLMVWNNDPVVLYYAEGGDITSWSLPDMQSMYRGVSQAAYLFIIELDGVPVGECWLQRMNLDRVLEQYSGLDVRRIDLMIGEKGRWGHGWGTRVIGLLTCYAFDVCSADLLYEPEIADYNIRSRRAFEKNGFRVIGEVPQKPGAKARVCYEMVLTREAYERSPGSHRGCGQV